MSEVMTAVEVADFLRLGINKTRRLITQGVIPSVRLGREYRVYRPALVAWVEASAGEHYVADPMTPARRRSLRAGASA